MTPNASHGQTGELAAPQAASVYAFVGADGFLCMVGRESICSLEKDETPSAVFLDEEIVSAVRVEVSHRRVMWT